MDFEKRISNLEIEARSVTARIDNLRGEYESAKEFTTKYLEECQKSGITKTAVGVSHKSIPCSVSFPFGVSGSVFGIGPNKKTGEHQWPAIWGVCERLHIDNGAGNADQHQADTSKLIDGVYHLRLGVWHKVN